MKDIVETLTELSEMVLNLKSKVEYLEFENKLLKETNENLQKKFLE